MMLRHSSLAGALVLGLTLTACSTAPGPQTRSAKAQRELTDALAGRVAGKPVNCIPNYLATNMQVIDDWTILFRSGRTVYVQNPRGGCSGLGFGRNTLVTRQVGTTDLCSGDINHLVDLQSGIGGGSCVFSDFVPYTKPRG